MLKMLSACTYELDNPLKAIHDIDTQLDLSNKLLKNSAAFLFCHSKYIETRAMEVICNSLPLGIVGCTSMYMGAAPAGRQEAGEFMLTVTVLTSDEIAFSAGLSEPLSGKNAADAVAALYRETAAPLGGTADLAFAFPPTMLDVPVDIFCESLDKAAGKTPVFGSVALDMDEHIRRPQTLYHGLYSGRAAAYSDRMPLLLIKGPVKPRFFSIRFPDKPVLSQNVVITEAEGPRLISINNKSAADFLMEVGILHKDFRNFTQAMPLIIEYKHKPEPEVVVIQNINTDGTLICGKHVMAGGTVNIGAISREYALESARTLIQEIKKNEKSSGVLIASCFLRSLALGGSSEEEVKLIQQELSGFPAPYLYINSGGELCPRYAENGETVNQALQYALVACQL